MKKNYLLAVAGGAVAAIVDLGFADLLWGDYYFSALIPVVFFLVLLSSLEVSLLFAASAGIVFDLASLGGFLVMTTFLLCQIILINFLKEKLVNFSSFPSIFGAVLILIILRAAIISAGATSVPSVALAGRVFVCAVFFSVLSALLYLIWTKRFRRGVEG